MSKNLPNHVAIIPDGNRRWARARKLLPWQGHAEGRNRFHEICETAFQIGIPFFSFWAASENNLLKRSRMEINFLISLILEEFQGAIQKKVVADKIRLRILGDWKNILEDKKLVDLIDDLENKTKSFTDRNLTIYLGYSGTSELVKAVQEIVSNRINPEAIDLSLIKGYAWGRELPPVDLEIRTGEERTDWSHRSSGFMMLHNTDSVLHTTKILWPDFLKEKFLQVIEEYSIYERRFGA